MDRRLNRPQEAVKSQHGRLFATNPLGTIQKRFLRWNGIRIHKHKELSKRTSKDFEKLSRWSFRQIDRVLFGDDIIKLQPPRKASRGQRHTNSYFKAACLRRLREIDQARDWFPNIRDDLHRYADMRTTAVSCSAFGSHRSAQP